MDAKAIDIAAALAADYWLDMLGELAHELAKLERPDARHVVVEPLHVDVAAEDTFNMLADMERAGRYPAELVGRWMISLEEARVILSLKAAEAAE